MLNSVMMYVAPFALTLVFAGGIRGLGGAECGVRAAGSAVVLSFLISWGFFLRPDWVPANDFSRIGHIALGAALVGLVLDLMAPRRFWAAAAAAIVLLISTWASVRGGLSLPAPLGVGWAASVAALTAAAFLVIARLDAARSHGAVALILLAAAALGLSLIAWVAGEPSLASTGLILVSSVLAYTVMQWAMAAAVGDSIILGAGAALLALAWALAEAQPWVRPAMIFLPLIFFAEGTAKRVPLPAARISLVLYPLVLAGLAALPLALAVVIAYVMAMA